MSDQGIRAQATAPSSQVLSNTTIRAALEDGLKDLFAGQKVLVLIPDHTRTLPLPYLFKEIIRIIGYAKLLDFMVALGTHPPLSEAQLLHLVGLTPEEKTSIYPHINLLNHAWDNPDALINIGVLTRDEIAGLAGNNWHPTLDQEVPIRINRAALEYDHILILGPTFPHEVVGFSGGEKYLFPGISGAEMINATHWLGALAGVVGTIGIKNTPVRDMIHAAAERLPTPVTLIALVVEGNELAGLFIGTAQAAWSAAADLSAQRHIRWVEKPFHRVLSWAPPMYDELWTGAKAMYKLEPAVEVGGELIIYAPHLDVVSHVHGKYIYEAGYHILQYFLNDWVRFKHIPLGVLAHSTHVRGSGIYEDGVEKPNVNVILSSKIPPEDCARLNLGYLDPAKISLDDWKNREQEGVLFVPKAGEMLYRAKK